MDGARLSRFPQFSWLGFRIISQAKPTLFSNHVHSRCHMVGMTAHGSQIVRWISRGIEKRWAMKTGAVNFFPRDGEQHTFLLSQEPFLDMPVFLIPDAHLRDCLNSDHHEYRAGMRQHTFHDDAVLQSCLRRLASPRQPNADDSGIQIEEAARRLVLRITELTGGGRPDWHDDESVFEPRVLRHLVNEIDEHLRIEPMLSDMAILVGLSPSHFAKKFRATTGLSLHRFISRRRIRASLESLKHQSQPLAHVALELGFSSQSHFTHVFSGLTGMTPAKYQKQFKRTVA